MQKDVGWLHVPVNDFQLFLQIVQCMNGRDRNLPQNVLGNSLHLTLAHVFVELVQRRRHDFHGDPAVAFLEDCTVELNDVATIVRFHHHVKIHNAFLLLLINDARTADSLK